MSLHQRSIFKFHWSHTRYSGGGHHVALEPNWCVSCKLPIQNDFQVFHMHTRLNWTAIYRIFWRKETHNYPKLINCTCINKNKKPSNKDNNILFFPKFLLQNLLYLAARYTGCIWNAWTQFKGEFFLLKQRKKFILIYVRKRVFNECFWNITFTNKYVNYVIFYLRLI